MINSTDSNYDTYVQGPVVSYQKGSQKEFLEMLNEEWFAYDVVPASTMKGPYCPLHVIYDEYEYRMGYRAPTSEPRWTFQMNIMISPQQGDPYPGKKKFNRVHFEKRFQFLQSEISASTIEKFKTVLDACKVMGTMEINEADFVLYDPTPQSDMFKCALIPHDQKGPWNKT